MTANHDLQRRLSRYYEAEPPLRAPDWVLQSALSTIESTPQRRGPTALGRYSTLATYTKLAAAAVVVLAVGGLALWQFAPTGPGGQPTPTPTPTMQPSASPSPTPRPTATTYVPGFLGQTFTSSLYGFSLRYPDGWAAAAATTTWMEGFLPLFGDSRVDTVFDADLRDHLFVGAGSQALNGQSLDEWQGTFLAAEGCGAWDEIIVGGVSGFIGFTCEVAMVEVDGRGYIFGLWSSDDDPQLRGLNTRALFLAVLATVQLQPGDAVDG